MDSDFVKGNCWSAALAWAQLQHILIHTWGAVDLQAKTEAKRAERVKERYDAHNRKIFKGRL